MGGLWIAVLRRRCFVNNERCYVQRPDATATAMVQWEDCRHISIRIPCPKHMFETNGTCNSVIRTIGGTSRHSTWARILSWPLPIGHLTSEETLPLGVLQ